MLKSQPWKSPFPCPTEQLLFHSAPLPLPVIPSPFPSKGFPTLVGSAGGGENPLDQPQVAFGEILILDFVLRSLFRVVLCVAV